MVSLKPPSERIAKVMHGITWSEQQYLQEQIAAAERVTQAEIVLGVAKRSSNYDFVALIIGIVLSFSIATILLYMKWWPYSFITLQLAQIVLAVVLQTVFVKTGWVISFVPQSHLHRTANRMASDMFYDYDLQATHQRNALLIFVSVQERMLFLLPDKVLRQRVPYQIWAELVENALRHKGRENLTHWLGHTIEACAKVLRRYDPSDTVNENELSNVIRFV
jgi:putative membrane protein